MLNFFGSSCFSAAISKKTACTSFSPVQTALSFSVFVFLFACFYIAALLVRADQLIAFFQHIAAALRAFLGRRFLPGHEIAFRIVFASIIFPSFFRLAQDHFFSGNPGQARNFPCGPYLTTMLRPQFSQMTSVTSSSTLTSSRFFSASVTAS